MPTTRATLRWAADRSLPAAVAASALAVVVLVAGPVLLLQRPTHRFLLWNLLLAWIPVVAALVLFGLLLLTVYLALGPPAGRGVVRSGG